MIELRKVSTTEANARIHLGAGQRLEFEAKDGVGSLILSHILPTNIPTDMTPLSSASGDICIKDPTKLLRLLAKSPLVTPDNKPNLTIDTPQLFWSLASNQLPPQISPFLGELSPIKNETDSPDNFRKSFDNGIPVGWEVTIGTIRSNGMALIPPPTLDCLLSKGNWTPAKPELPKEFVVRLPLLLGRLTLPYLSCQQLQPGDVVIPQAPLFSPAGLGRIESGKLRIFLESMGYEHKNLYKVTSLEDITMNDVLNDYDINPTDEDIESRLTEEHSEYDEDELPIHENYDEYPPDEEYMDEDSDFDGSHNDSQDELTESHPPPELQKTFDSLPLNLTIETGQVSLSMAELKQLTVGSLVTAEGVSPGQAVLRYQGQTIARGELVDVEGRLGLQITSVEIN